MSFNWETVPFEELYLVPSRNGVSKPSRVRGSGYKMINMGELFANDRIFDIPMELVPLTNSEKINAKVESGDLLFARQSLIESGAGKCSIVCDVSNLTVFESHIIRVRLAKDIADSLFYYYYFKSGVSPIRSIVQHSVQAGIKASDLAKLPVILPKLSTQRRIASILSALDEKIEVNNKINDILEQQAQAIFHSWFVDLTPFGGTVPPDWRTTVLGKVCSCELGGTPSRAKSEFWNGEIPWINSGEVNLFRITRPSETITSLGLSKSATKLLPAKTTVIAITGATLGQVSLLEIDSCANQSVVGIIPNDNLPYEYIYPFIKQSIHELISHQTGGAQQHINKQNVEALSITIPSDAIIEQYREITTSLYVMIANNCFENEHLAEIRDSLLPKLMSGEIDVSTVSLGS